MVIQGAVVQTEIHASPEMVRKTFLDFASYPQWNPFIKSLKVTKGSLEAVTSTPSPSETTRLKAFIQPPGGQGMTFTPVVLRNDAEEFRWIGMFLGGWFVSGEHYFRFEKLDDGKTKFVQGEVFSGIAAGLFLALVGTEKVEKGFEAMNQALKKRCEEK